MHIEGMSCGHCKAAVEKALQAVSGVVEAEVNLAQKTAEVTAEPAVTAAMLTQAMEDAGYAVKSVS
jgi:copper chaperone CopZ